MFQTRWTKRADFESLQLGCFKMCLILTKKLTSLKNAARNKCEQRTQIRIVRNHSDHNKLATTPFKTLHLCSVAAASTAELI